jgi:hypothetical protein
MSGKPERDRFKWSRTDSVTIGMVLFCIGGIVGDARHHYRVEPRELSVRLAKAYWLETPADERTKRTRANPGFYYICHDGRRQKEPCDTITATLPAPEPEHVHWFIQEPGYRALPPEPRAFQVPPLELDESLPSAGCGAKCPAATEREQSAKVSNRTG